MKKALISIILLLFVACAFAVKKPLSIKELLAEIKSTESPSDRSGLLEKLKKTDPNEKENLTGLLEANREEYEPGGIVDASRAVYAEFSNRKLIPVLRKYLKNRNPKVVFLATKYFEDLDIKELLNPEDCEAALVKVLKKYYPGMRDLLISKKEYPEGIKVENDESMLLYSTFWSAACSIKILGDLGTEKSVKILEKYILLEDNSIIDDYLMHSLLALNKRGVKNITDTLERGPLQEESWKKLKKKYKETHQ